MIYYPDRQLEATPDVAGLSYENVFLTTLDGVHINGWFIPAKTPAKTGQPSPTILFLHGNARNISHRIEKLAVFHQLGVSVLIIDYRGYAAAKARRTKREPIATPKLPMTTLPRP